jgi:hypothetical protein
MSFYSIPYTSYPRYDPLARQQFAPGSGNYYATPPARPATSTPATRSQPSLIQPLARDIAPSAPTASSAPVPQSHDTEITDAPDVPAVHGQETDLPVPLPSEEVAQHPADSGFCSSGEMMVDDKEGSSSPDYKLTFPEIQKLLDNTMSTDMEKEEATDIAMSQTNGSSPRIETPSNPVVAELRVSTMCTNMPIQEVVAKIIVQGNQNNQRPSRPTPSKSPKGRPVPGAVVAGIRRQRKARKTNHVTATPQRPSMPMQTIAAPVPQRRPHMLVQQGQQGYERQMVHPAQHLGYANGSGSGWAGVSSPVGHVASSQNFQHPEYATGSGSAWTNVSSPVNHVASPENFQYSTPPRSSATALANACEVEQFKWWSAQQRQYYSGNFGTLSYEDHLRRFRMV